MLRSDASDPAVSWSKAEVVAHSSITSGRTPLRALAELAAVAALATFIERTQAYLAYPLVALLIASRQHALLVLMHECAHFRAAKNRTLNDVLGELIGWGFLMSMRGYRRHHLRHHVAANINTGADPDYARLTRDGWRFPMRRTTLLVQVLRDVFLLNTPELIKEARDARNNVVETRADAAWLVGRVVFLCLLVAALCVTGAWRAYLLYWLLPSLTFLKALLRLRAIVDHFGLPDRTIVDPTRTVLAPWWERLLLAPCNIGIHHVHHAWPSIPYYRLRAAHERLWSQAAYRQRVRVSSSYLRALLDECCPRAEVKS